MKITAPTGYRLPFPTSIHIEGELSYDAAEEKFILWSLDGSARMEISEAFGLEFIDYARELREAEARKEWDRTHGIGLPLSMDIGSILLPDEPG